MTMKANHRGKKKSTFTTPRLEKILTYGHFVEFCSLDQPPPPLSEEETKRRTPAAACALPSALRFACANAGPVLPVPQLQRRRGFEAGRLGDGALDLAGRGPGVPHHRLGGFVFLGGRSVGSATPEPKSGSNLR